MAGNNKQAAMGFIFVTMLIDIIGVGIIVPVLPRLLEQLTHSNVSQASRYGGWLLFAYAVMQMIFAPVIGNLSDKYGRRPVLLLSLLGFFVDYLILALASNIQWLFIGRILAGITGASMTTASAYIADISDDSNRTKNFGLVGAAFGVGFVIGPVLGGLLGHYGPRVPFYGAAVLCLLNFVYGYFILPESLDKNLRRPFDIKRANPFGALKMLQRYPALRGIFIGLMFMMVAGHAVSTNWSFYTMYRFNWKELDVGISLGVIGILVGLVQGVLIRWINPRLGNEKSILYGLAIMTVGLILFAFADKSWMMYVFLLPYCLGMICGPAYQAVVAENVPANEQGEIQGTMTILSSATAIIGPPLMTGVFAHFTQPNSIGIFPGAPFLLGAVLGLAGAVISYLAFHSKYRLK